MMTNVLIAGTVLYATAALALGQASPAAAKFRPPAVPLVTSTPYLSVWSEADRLTDDVTRHWTGTPQPLTSLVVIDGRPYRLMGNTPAAVPAFPQTDVRVTPTRSIYAFDDGHVRMTLTFTTPALPDRLDVLCRPLTYLAWQAESSDGRPHTVRVCQAVSGLIAVNTADQAVACRREAFDGMAALSVGSVSQNVLGHSGDKVRIDWGRGYLTASQQAGVSAAVGPAEQLLASFIDAKPLPTEAELPAAPPSAGDPSLLLAFDLGEVSATPVRRLAVVAYDEVQSIQYFDRTLRPFWKRDGQTPQTLLGTALREYDTLVPLCEAFDHELTADLTHAGGEKYADLGALSYRQALAGCGWACDDNGQLLIFAKENSSNGCAATVDVIYPAAPLFLLMGPTYAKALVQPAMAYGADERWKYPFAPHDVGVYPKATGQAYGVVPPTATDFSQMMPVEESANLILLCDAIAHMEGHADYAGKYWPALTQWVSYLVKHGKDPENQLCTDDFMGHLAHNANLSAKAILAIAAYGDLAKMRGDADTAARYAAVAKDYAAHWVAQSDADHSRNAFDRPGSWSQKYNLVWDRLLGLNVFGPDVAAKEIAWYVRHAERFGVPLDSRTTVTKSDWCVWSATMAETPADFRAFVEPVWRYLNETTERMPLTDQYDSTKLRHRGFHARPVVGGHFMKLLADPAVWKKYAARDVWPAGKWTPFAPLPTVTEVVLTANTQAAVWKYTTTLPVGDWQRPDFDDAAWKEGPAGFGTPAAPGGELVRTVWNTRDIWLRRSFDLTDAQIAQDLQVYLHHDDDVEVYINGVPALQMGGWFPTYEFAPMSPAARATLRPGRNTFAVHCRQDTGGQYIDVGLCSVTRAKPTE